MRGGREDKERVGGRKAEKTERPMYRTERQRKREEVGVGRGGWLHEQWAVRERSVEREEAWKVGEVSAGKCKWQA